MTFVKIEIKIVWKRQQTDLSKCIACDDVIYGDMVQAFVRSGETDKPIKSIVLCQSCFELLNYEPE